MPNIVLLLVLCLWKQVNYTFMKLLIIKVCIFRPTNHKLILFVQIGHYVDYCLIFFSTQLFNKYNISESLYELSITQVIIIQQSIKYTQGKKERKAKHWRGKKSQRKSPFSTQITLTSLGDFDNYQCIQSLGGGSRWNAYAS